MRRGGYEVEVGSVLARDNAEYLDGGTKYSTISCDILCCSFPGSSKIWCIVEQGCTLEVDVLFISVSSSSKEAELNWSSGR